MLEYRSIDDLNRIIIASLDKFGLDLDLIVGIPRSGMLPATILALHLNLPLTDLEGYLDGRFVCDSNRLKVIRERRSGETTSRELRVLVIDDSLWSGKAMQAAKEKIAQKKNRADKIIFATVYVRPDQCHQVDIWLEQVRSRFFEWNIMNHSLLSAACVDIDGVLCRDPTEEENDDGVKYENFIALVPPLYRPCYEIGWLVTSRLEKYRNATERWLSLNGVSYKNLIMMDVSSKQERIASKRHAEFKADIYRKTDSVLFIESSSRQADQIARITRKPVFCLENRKVFYGTSIKMLRAHDSLQRSGPIRFMAWASRPIRKAIRSILGSPQQ
jgi:orotate phosphoribosyltransferase